LPAYKSKELNKSTPVGKMMLAAKKRHEVAIASFTMAITTEGVMGLDYKASTPDWPSGLVAVVVQGLLKKH
jgi:hypothetical protein